MVENIVNIIIIFVIFIVLFDFLHKIATKIYYFIKNKIFERQFTNRTKKYLSKQQKIEKKKKDYKFFGTIELIFENCEQEEEMKKECYSIIQEKIETQYKNYNCQILINDKIFFVYKNIDLTDKLIDDLINLSKTFKNINQKKYITTSIKISILAKTENTNLEIIQKVLQEMSAYNLKNQIIVNEDFCTQYKKKNSGAFDFHPLGLIKFLENDEDFEVYKLLRK